MTQTRAENNAELHALMKKYDCYGYRPPVTKKDKQRLLELAQGDIDVHMRHEHGETFLHLCRNPQFTFLIPIFLDKGSKIDALSAALQTPLISLLDGNYKNLKGANLLIDAGCELTQKDDRNWDALSYAWYPEARKTHARIQKLIDQRASEQKRRKNFNVVAERALKTIRPTPISKFNPKKN